MNVFTPSGFEAMFYELGVLTSERKRKAGKKSFIAGSGVLAPAGCTSVLAVYPAMPAQSGFGNFPWGRGAQG